MYKRQVLVVLDEAYLEFCAPAGASDSLELLQRHPNLCLLRTLSKAYGLAGLRVLHAVKDGHATSALSDGDKRKIERTIAEDVLDTRRHAEALFRGKAEPVGGSYRISGELTLHGKTRPLTVAGQARDGRQVFEVSLHQPDFGIKPYSAMLGTLKVKADVKVRIAVPWPAS